MTNRELAAHCRYQASFPLKTFDGRRRLADAFAPGTITFGKDGKAAILCIAWVVFEDSQESQETGEIRHFHRATLFASDGSTFRSTSEYLIERLPQIWKMFDQEEQEQGIPFVIVQRRGDRSGRTYHDIRVSDRPVTGG